MSEEEESDPGTHSTNVLDTDEPNSQTEKGLASADSDEDYEEWTGFDRSSETDEDPVIPPENPQETAVVPPPPRPGSKYVPPHLRKAAADTQTQLSESLVKLTKQLKGLLNRYPAYLLPLLFTLREFSV